jgi:hypothetical protein
LIPKDRDQRGPSFNTAFPIAETLDDGLLLLGGAAVYRCGKRPIFKPASAAEGTTPLSFSAECFAEFPLPTGLQFPHDEAFR